MPLFPGADLKLLPENNTQPAITPRLFIMHTAIDGQGTSGLFNWWQNAGNNLESHLYFQKLGGVEQYMDTGIRADANNKANLFAVSAESWDGRAPNKPANPWTDEQVVSILAVMDWACRVHDIPRRLADRWDGSGIGYHNQFIEWSLGGTSCPGNPRKDQLVNVIIPALVNLGQPQVPNRKKNVMPWSLVRLVDGRLVRFTTYMGAIVHAWQPRPNAGPWSNWVPLNNPGTAPGAFDSVTAECNADGRMEIIAWNSAYMAAFTCWQTTPGGGWSAWVKL